MGKLETHKERTRKARCKSHKKTKKKSRESYPNTSSSSSVSRSQKTLGACLLSLSTRSPTATQSIAGGAKDLSPLRRLGLPRPFAAPFPRLLLPRFVTPPPSPAAPSGSSEMAMASARGGKKRLENWRGKGRVGRRLAMEKRGGRPSPSFLFLSSVRPWSGGEAGGLGADTAAEAPRRNPSRPCGDRSIGFQILKRLGGDGEWRETGKGGKSAKANPACAAPWFAFPSPGAPAVHKYGI